ncbi:MAG: hypothetical protein ABG776_18165 [Cyanobacteria bacterium J06555_13]
MFPFCSILPAESLPESLPESVKGVSRQRVRRGHVLPVPVWDQMTAIAVSDCLYTQIFGDWEKQFSVRVSLPNAVSLVLPSLTFARPPRF